MVGNHFDPVPYNYVFNKNTAFTEGEFVTADHEQLALVLTNLKRISPAHVEIINYTNSVHLPEGFQLNSALHRSVNDGNQRSVNFLLEAMSHIQENSSANYVSIFSELLEYSQFFAYFGNLQTQTFVMEEKETFKSSSPVNDKIIAQTSRSQIFFTSAFYETDKTGLGEDHGQDAKNYAVKVSALRADWILNSKEGGQFLYDLLASDNLEFYQMESVQIIVEFLFVKFKSVILYLLLPIYLFAHITYFLLLRFNGQHLDLLVEAFAAEAAKTGYSLHNDDLTIAPDSWELERRSRVLIAAGCSALLWLVQLVQVSVFLKNTGSGYFSQFYNWLDLLYLGAVAYTFYELYWLHFAESLSFEDYEQKVKVTRAVGVVGYVALYAKASYFLSLVDSIAPLIDIIIKIVADIKWFLLVSVVYLLMFAQAYDLIAQNQIDFDELSEDEIEMIPYRGLPDAVWYMLQTFLGSASTAGFDVGLASQSLILKCMFTLSTFLIITHFLNMLIAIMGNTFGERTEVGHLIMSRDHLRFVVLNWHLIRLAIPDPVQLKYIISATTVPPAGEMTAEEQRQYLIDKLTKLEKNLTDKVRVSTELNSDTSILVAEILRTVKPSKEN